MADENDSALLDELMSDKAPEPAKETEPVAEAPPKGPDRDPETGKFRAKAEEAAKEPDAQIAPKADPAEPEPHQRHEGIPSWRLKEEADAKREALERASKYEAEAKEARERAQRYEQQLRQYTEKKPEPVDLHENPEAWQKQLNDNFERRLTNERLLMAESMARLHFGDAEIDGALDWAEKNLKPQEVDAIIQSRNPFGTLIGRKKQAETLAEIGTDPKAYREKVLADAMKDPEFVKAVLSQAKTEAASRPEQHVTKLPPSLNRASTAASAKSDAGDPNGIALTDAELLADALRR